MPYLLRRSACRMRRVCSSTVGVMAAGTSLSGRWVVGQRDAQRAAFGVAGQHHDDDKRGAGFLGQVFGMSGEMHAGLVDDALMHRRRRHGGKPPDWQPGRASSRPAHRGRWRHRAGQASQGWPAAHGDIEHSVSRLDLPDGTATTDVQAEQGGAFRRAAVGQNNWMRGAGIGPGPNTTRPDTGRFAAGDGNMGTSLFRRGGFRRRSGRATAAASPGKPRRACVRGWPGGRRRAGVRRKRPFATFLDLDQVHAERRLDNRLICLVHFQRVHRLLEFRHGIAGIQPAEIAALGAEPSCE